MKKERKQLERDSKPYRFTPESYGSKERNLRNKLWLNKQVNDSRIPGWAKAALNSSRNPIPYPLGGSDKEKAAWADKMGVEVPKPKSFRVGEKNLGSSKRNLEKGTWVKIQLASSRVSDSDKELLSKAFKYGVARPFPIGGSPSDKEDWRAMMRTIISLEEKAEAKKRRKEKRAK